MDPDDLLGARSGQLAAKLAISRSRLSTLEADPAGLTVDRLLLLAKLLGLEVVLQDEGEAVPPATEW
ncbi:MAG: helix-turn-helix domain-containing protein [Polyangiales bacterium]